MSSFVIFCALWFFKLKSSRSAFDLEMHLFCLVLFTDLRIDFWASSRCLQFIVLLCWNLEITVLPWMFFSTTAVLECNHSQSHITQSALADSYYVLSAVISIVCTCFSAVRGVVGYSTEGGWGGLLCSCISILSARSAKPPPLLWDQPLAVAVHGCWTCFLPFSLLPPLLWPCIFSLYRRKPLSPRFMDKNVGCCFKGWKCPDEKLRSFWSFTKKRKPGT